MPLIIPIEVSLDRGRVIEAAKIFIAKGIYTLDKENFLVFCQKLLIRHGLNWSDLLISICQKEDTYIFKKLEQLDTTEQAEAFVSSIFPDLQ